MRLGKLVSPAAIIIFSIIVSIVFFLRATCEANEICYQPVCVSDATITTANPELPAQNGINYDKHDAKDTFESLVAHFLEKHESSPPR